MLITIFNAILIVLITVVSYKYFSLRESLSSEKHRAIAYAEALGTLNETIEAYENSHVKSMATMAMELGQARKLDSEQLEALTYAVWLHDIGELLLPRELLKSSEKLSRQNLFLLRTHPLLGEFELKNRCSVYDEVPAIIRWHHERWDGNGYPDCLKGEEIPVTSRIIALVDSVSAMKSVRPYREKAMTHREVLRELDLQAGLQFDPELVEIFKGLYPDLKEELH